MPIVTMETCYKSCKRKGCRCFTPGWCFQINGLTKERRDQFMALMSPFKWVELEELFHCQFSSPSALLPGYGQPPLYFCLCEQYRQGPVSNMIREVLTNAHQVPMEFVTNVLNILESIGWIVVSFPTSNVNVATGCGPGSPQQIWTLKNSL